jgi:hypothetical protein
MQLPHNVNEQRLKHKQQIVFQQQWILNQEMLTTQ